MPASYASFDDPAAALKRRLMQQMDPSGATATDPTAPAASPAQDPTEPAPFAQTAGTDPIWRGEVPLSEDPTRGIPQKPDPFAAQSFGATPAASEGAAPADSLWRGEIPLSEDPNRNIPQKPDPFAASPSFGSPAAGAADPIWRGEIPLSEDPNRGIPQKPDEVLGKAADPGQPVNLTMGAQSGAVTTQPAAPPVMLDPAKAPADAASMAPGQDTAPAPTVPDPTAAPDKGTNTNSSSAASVVQGGTEDGIKALYAKYKLHVPTSEEVQNWLTGAYGGARSMAEVEAQIASSEEAQRQSPTGPAGATRTDQSYIRSVVDSWMQTHNTQGHQDPNYWVQRITESGGLGQDNMNYWLGRFTEAPGTHQEGSPAPAGGSGGSGSAPAAAGNSTYDAFLQSLMAQQQAQQAQKAQVRAMLMDRLGKASQPVDENGLEIASPLSAARDETQRSQQTERTALAERMYAQGGGSLNSGALGQAIQQSSERNAGGLSQLRAGLITKAYDDKRQEMMGLLQMALASGDTESAQLLQAQISQLSATVQREGMGLSLAEFMAQLNQNTANAGLHG